MQTLKDNILNRKLVNSNITIFAPKLPFIIKTDIMEFELFITIMVGIFGPLISLYIRYKIDQGKYPTSSNERLKKLIKPNWKGYFEQIDPIDNSIKLRTDINLQLSNKGKKIIGEANAISLHDNTQIPFVLTITNGIFDGNILKIEYRNKDLGVFQKGSVMVELNGHGDKLKGLFVGYSPTLKQIISGEANLKCTETNGNKN